MEESDKKPGPLRATVLVVDDIEENRYVKSRTLQRAGYSTREAGCGTDAVRMAGEGVDLVVLDVRMPDFDGFEAARRIRADPRTASIPVLMLTASAADVESKVRGLGVADAYLAEPVQPGELTATVDSLLRRRRLDETNAEQRKMEAIGRLAGGLAHDFNNLLTVVVGYAKLSLEEVQSDSPLADNLREIYQAGEECAALTRQLLAFSRRQISRPVELKIDVLLSDLAKPLKRVLGTHVDLKLELAGGDEPIVADPSQLEQVLLMLAINARDAIAKEGRVTLQTQVVELDQAAVQPMGLTPGKYLRLCVSDTGGGMDGATRARVFEPFFTTKGMGRGTGLGLAAVLGMVQQNGGGIDVDSELARGTTFRIYLPQKLPKPAPQALPPAPVVDPRTGTVLVVEDEPVVRAFARSVLVAKGFTVHTAVDGEDALNVFRQHRPQIDLVLSDIVMPRMDGFALAEALEKMAPEVPVTLMSGHPSPGEVLPHTTVVTRSILAKPFTHRQLLEHVRSRMLSRVKPS